MNKTVIDDLTARMRDLMSRGPVADLEKNMRALLGSAFERLDLVTREEYDVQRQVLLRTREKLTALETRVAELEARGAASSPGTPPA